MFRELFRVSRFSHPLPSFPPSQAEGYVIGSCIKHIPIAGRDITAFVQQLLRDREPQIPPAQSLETAKEVKERFSYICPDIVKEFGKYDSDPSMWIKQHQIIDRRSKKPITIDVGYERFLGPEIFFHPEFANPEFQTSISETVDTVVQGCPIDVRRGLYKVRGLCGDVLHGNLTTPPLPWHARSCASQPLILPPNRTLCSLAALPCSRILAAACSATSSASSTAALRPARL